MSKHRRKTRYNEGDNSSFKQGSNPVYNNSFGINPRQLLGMLGGNLNMNGLSNLLSSMNMDGFNLNSLGKDMNIESNNNFKSTMNNNNNNTDNKNSSSNNNNNNKDMNNQATDSVGIEKKSVEIEDENVEMLIALKSIVDPNRIKFIEQVIDLYKKGEIKENIKKDE